MQSVYESVLMFSAFNVCDVYNLRRENRSSSLGVDQKRTTKQTHLWIHIYYFTISFVFEKKSRSIVCDHMIIWAGIRRGVLGVPVVEAVIK